MVEKNSVSIKYILAQATILVLIISMPLHFYINSALENNEYKDKEALQEYAFKVSNQIYKFSNSNKKEFYFPRSNIYTSAIYDKEDNVIFSLLKTNIKPFNTPTFKKDGFIYLKYNLKENIFHASSLIVAKKISHVNIILNVLVVLIGVAFLVFLATFFIIRESARPYKKFNLYLENFIKDAMHEMKTPIGVILLNLDGLNALYQDNKMIQRAKSAIKNMMVVYEDLEYFVKEKKIKHPKQKIDLSQFSKERIEFFKDLLFSKDITVVQNLQKELYVHFSHLELSRIIDNTLSNAIKYSKNNTTITISLEKIKDKIILKIQDEGRGIKDIESIFQRYYRGDKITGGFGIGLSIVKNICDENKVIIQVESTPKVGSTFSFYFNYANV